MQGDYPDDTWQDPDLLDSELDDENLKSKSQIKRELKDITKFGHELAELGMHNLKKLPLTEEILEAFLNLDKMKGHEARKRHFKFIGKRLREIDLEPVEHALNRFKQGLPLVEPKAKEPTLWENWTYRFLEQNENPEEFISEFPSTDRQQLRQLMRNAQKDKKNAKKLEHYLKSIIENK